MSRPTLRKKWPLRRISILVALALVSACAAVISVLPISAIAPTPGSGTYAFGAGSYNVAAGQSVAITVTGSSLQNSSGTGSGGPATTGPQVCFTVAPGSVNPATAVTEFIPQNGVRTFGSSPQTITVVTTSSAQIGHTIAVALSLPCANAATGQSDGGIISPPSSVTVTIVAAASPTVTSISPTSSSVVGTAITVFGTNFAAGATVQFGGGSPILASNITSGQLTVAVPAGLTSGQQYHVVVSTGAGSSTPTSADLFTFNPTSNQPTVTLLSPNTCSTSGNQQITVFGTNFVPGQTTVFFNGINSGFGTVVASNGLSLTVFCPAMAVGTYHVQVSTTTGGTSIPTPNDLITYGGISVFAPVVTGVFPQFGPINGGNYVTITGQNLAGVLGVTFGGVQATSIVSVSSTQLSVIAPPSYGNLTVDVQVSTSAGTSVINQPADLYTYGGTIFGNVTPSTDANQCGTTFSVTITGTGFTPGGLGMAVSFGGVASPAFTVPNSQTIIAVVPGHAAGSVDVTVSINGVATYTYPSAFTYTCSAVPIVTSVSPASGGPGTSVVITGAGFTGTVCPGGVTFGGVAAQSCVVNSDGSITAVVPTSAPTGNIIVRVSNGLGTSVSGANFSNNAPVSTVSFQLFPVFTLIGWLGQDNVSAASALAGGATGTTNVSGVVTVIWRFDAASQTFRAYFPGHETDGLSDFTTLQRGVGYWIGMAPGTPSTTWTVVSGG